MQEAIHYGKVELIPGIICDGYVLNDGTAVMSERGTADLLGIKHAPFKRVVPNWPPKTLKPFIDEGLSVVPKSIKVVAKNSPYQAREIVVYNTNLIESMIRAYVMASAHNALQKNQLHIGKRCSILVCALTRTALEASIMDYSTIRSIGYKAPRMNGYHLEDVGKIAVGMDTVIGIELKQRVFGEISSLAKPKTKGEIEWRKVLTTVFAGFGLQCNYPIGKYKADFFIEKLMLVLECNGYDHHQYYDKKLEKQREQFIKQRYSMVRFHHKIQLEALFNGILQAKMGTVIKLYNIKHLYPNHRIHDYL